MRILIFTNRDLASNYNLNCLLPKIHQSVSHIFLSDQVGKGSVPLPQALQDLKWYEQTLPNQYIFPSIDAQNKEINTHDPISNLLTFNALSKYYSIPVQSWNDVKSESALQQLSALSPDLILSVRYGKIFGSEFLKIPRLGVLNLHSGLLPNYRGVLAMFRAKSNGDKTLHGTLHYIDDPTIDTGRVVAYSTLKADPNLDLLTQILNLYPASVPMIVEAIETLRSGNGLTVIPQSEEHAAYYTFPNESEVDFFIKNGGIFADPHRYASMMRLYTG